MRAHLIIVLVSAAILTACSGTRTAFLPLNYPDPDQALIAVSQHIAVIDKRPVADVLFRDSSRKFVFKPVPEVTDVMRLILAQTMLIEYPGFAEALTRSDLRLTVSVDALEGRAAEGAATAFAYDLNTSAGTPGAPLRPYRGTISCLAMLDDAAALGICAEKALRTLAGTLAKDFVRDASPYLPLPPVRATPPSIAS